MKKERIAGELLKLAKEMTAGDIGDYTIKLPSADGKISVIFWNFPEEADVHVLVNAQDVSIKDSKDIGKLIAILQKAKRQLERAGQ